MIAKADKDNGGESVKEAARHLAHNASADVAELGGDLAHLKDEIVNAVKQAFASAREGARDKASDACESALDRSADAAKRLGTTIIDNPLTSVAVAAGVGLILGLFMFRRH
ncbi:MAG: hypothetical protein ABSH20_19530 [Tepidisphaeraceae bacterium]|jgi:ElaB/YqjD/DUF883 family membrane-anchored ribosome-binding protein